MLYFFDLYERDGVTLDEEGVRCGSLADAVEQAIDSLRSIASADVRRGTLRTDCRIDLRSIDGGVRKVWLSEAVAVD